MVIVGVRDWHGDVGLALGDDDLVGLVPHDGHGLALEPGHQVLVEGHGVHHGPVDFRVLGGDRRGVDLGAMD